MRLAFVFIVLLFASPAAAQLAFPGAEGAGSDTRHAFACGMDPTVIKVTNLNDSGAGSLRQAYEVATGPRIIIFETSGTIILDSDIFTVDDCVWIAGQTAPSPGIQVRADSGCPTADPNGCGGIQFFGDQAMFEHFRIRPGDFGPAMNSTTDHNALYIRGSQVVVKHMSLEWAAGKALQYDATTGGTNMLTWRNIFGECLYRAANTTDDYEGEGQISGIAMHWFIPAMADMRADAIGNLFAHCDSRQPEWGYNNNGGHNVINNIVYDFGNGNYGGTDGLTSTAMLVTSGGGSGETWYANVVGNKYISRNPTPTNPLFGLYISETSASSELYVSDQCEDDALEPITLFAVRGGYTDPSQGSPATGVALPSTIQACSGVEAWVAARVGAWPGDRDSVDTRILSQLSNRTGALIDSQDDVGGYPTLAVNTINHDSGAHPKPATTSADTDKDGYKDIEEWLHSYACEVEGGSGCWGDSDRLRVR